MATTQDSKIEQIVEALKREFRPSRLFLYGSRANGNARPDSDYDFVMILSEFDGDRYSVMREIFSKFWETLNVAVQVWVYSEEEFKFRKDDFGSIPETAMNTGKEIDLGL